MTIPKYMYSSLENPRGLHAVRVLQNRKDFTLDRLIAAAFDTYLPAFESLIPSLVKAYDALPASDTLTAQLAEQIAALKAWDFRWSAASIPTSLAVYWGNNLMAQVGNEAESEDMSVYDYMAARTTPRQRVDSVGGGVGAARSGFRHLEDAVG